MSDNRKKYVKIRVTQAEHDMLKQYAKQTGKTMSQLFRDFLEYQVKTNLKPKE